MIYNIIICGIGGQGVVLVSNIIGEACAISGQKAISGEMHGLAQRSGSIIIHQRIGEDALSPLIPYGDADVILGLEISETLRYLFYLKPGGDIVSSTRSVHPPGDSQNLVSGKIKGYTTYDQIIGNIKRSGARLSQVNGLSLAKKAGNPLTENVVMLGALAAQKKFPVKKEILLEAVNNIVPSKAIDVNIKAFESGYLAISDIDG